MDVRVNDNSRLVLQIDEADVYVTRDKIRLAAIETALVDALAVVRSSLMTAIARAGAK
jgi:hypothetical protein